MNNKIIFKSIAAILSIGLIFTSGFLVAQSFYPKQSSNNADTDERFDISSLNGIAIDKSGEVSGTNYFYDDSSVTAEALRISLSSYFTNVKSMPNVINELTVGSIDIDTHSFVLSCVNNSKTFKNGKSATINYLTQTKLNLSSIVGDYFACEVNKYEDENLTKNEILHSLKTKHASLNINQLEVVELNSSTGKIQPITNSTIYSPSAVTINVGFTLVTRCSLSYDNSTLTATTLNAVPTFRYNGTNISIDTSDKFS
jgi:hypothetical protein